MRRACALPWLLAGLPALLFSGPKESPNPELQKKLESIYVPAVMAGKNEIARPGVLLTVLRADVTGGPSSSVADFQNNYKNGHLRGSWSNVFTNQAEQIRKFQLGEPVFVTRVEVNPEDISLHVISADAFDGIRYRAAVNFKFPKGYLATADAGPVLRIVDQVLGREPGGAAPAEPAAREPEPLAVDPPPPPLPPEEAQAGAPLAAPPQTITLGQTPGQVTAILGPPQRVEKQGSKEFYFYKDLKAVFVNGRLDDVQ